MYHELPSELEKGVPLVDKQEVLLGYRHLDNGFGGVQSSED
jgi:hypothetical protein